MVADDGFGACQVGYGAGDLQDAIVPAGAELQVGHRELQQLDRRLSQCAIRLDFPAAHPGVTVDFRFVFEPLLLAQKGSLFFTRPSLGNYIADRKELEWRAADIFQWIAEKKLVLRIDHEYQLAYAAQAHRDLEGRQTSGKLILLI